MSFLQVVQMEYNFTCCVKKGEISFEILMFNNPMLFDIKRETSSGVHIICNSYHPWYLFTILLKNNHPIVELFSFKSKNYLD